MKKAIVTQLRLYQKKKIYECSGSGSSDVVAAVNDRIFVLGINNARSRKPCTNNAYPKGHFFSLVSLINIPDKASYNWQFLLENDTNLLHIRKLNQQCGL